MKQKVFSESHASASQADVYRRILTHANVCLHTTRSSLWVTSLPRVEQLLSLSDICILLFMCPNNTIYGSVFLKNFTPSSSPIYVWLETEDLILLYICPHTTMYVSSWYYMCPDTQKGFSARRTSVSSLSIRRVSVSSQITNTDAQKHDFSPTRLCEECDMTPLCVVTRWICVTCCVTCGVVLPRFPVPSLSDTTVCASGEVPLEVLYDQVLGPYPGSLTMLLVMDQMDTTYVRWSTVGHGPVGLTEQYQWWFSWESVFLT
jgi:hypothetical protein